MKNIFFLSLFFVSCYSIGQSTKPINLSYNYKKLRCDIRKVIKNDNTIDFYIKNELFSSIKNDNPQVLDSITIKKIKIIGIEEFLNLAQIERNKLINQGKKLGVIKVLTNDKVFNQIFLYVREKEMILKYHVRWVEKIE